MRARPRIAALIAALTVLVALFASGSGRASVPDSATIKTPKDAKPGVKQTLTYQGGPLQTGAPSVRPPGTDAPTFADEACAGGTSSTCDTFKLRVDLPPTYWDAPGRYGSITISVLPKAGSFADLYVDVLDADGATVTKSNLATFREKVLAFPLPRRGVYTIRTTVATGSNATFTTTITFALEKDAALTPNVTPAPSIRFTPATLVDPQAQGGEPGLNFDRSGGGRVFIDWPMVPGLASAINRSTDGGHTFRRLVAPACFYRGKPNCVGGSGNDSETAITKGGRIYFTDQEELGSQGAAVSDDHGNTFPVTSDWALTAPPESDRMFLAVSGENDAYMFYTGDAGVNLVKSTDGGRTWIPKPGAITGGAEAHAVADETGGPNNGVIYDLSRSPMQMIVSKDKGATFAVHPVLPASWPHTVLGVIPWLSLDTAGNLYVTFNTSDDGGTWLTTSLASDPGNRSAPGSVWSPPVRLSASPARTAVFNAAAVGSPGRIAVAYYGADAVASPDEMTDGQQWWTYASFSTNALCQWKKQCGATKVPAFQQSRVSHRPNHYGNICTGGLGCTTSGLDRSLLDFLDVGVSKDGVVGVVFNDNNRAGHVRALEPEVMFATVENGPNLLAGKPGLAKRSPATLTTPDQASDATYPFTGGPTGSNRPKADLRSVGATTTGSALSIQVDLADASNLVALPTELGMQRVLYLTRWWFGRESYFAAYEVASTGATRAFWGRLSETDGLQFGRRQYAAAYTADGAATAAVSKNRLTITVPRSAVGAPKAGDTLYAVNSFVLAGYREEITQIPTMLNTLDASPPFDYVVPR